MPYTIIHNVEEVKKILNKLGVTVFNSGTTAIQGAANFAVGAGRQEAHVRTGHMKANIQQQKVSDEEIKILSKAIYSGYENARGPPHNFFDKMYERTKQRFPDMAISEVTHNIRNAKVS